RCYLHALFKRPGAVPKPRDESRQYYPPAAFEFVAGLELSKVMDCIKVKLIRLESKANDITSSPRMRDASWTRRSGRSGIPIRAGYLISEPRADGSRFALEVLVHLGTPSP